MTVDQLLVQLMRMPKEAVVLMESDDGLSRVSAVAFIESQGAGAPAEVILQPSNDE